ncbi:phosphogluconate dehydrogenase C-terminal domain-containing protein [Sulfitobacter marinus]|uniref:phosphogluconate dehydrogenase C-terminal domain-containing protein n=1 Tax=Sulfitobacter marinus TaxID=394264 RepID=UPI002481B955|nr:phosphogluconate dehydrogenase C-terminal domain-containing protein [Sulfitobacter marinus]
MNVLGAVIFGQTEGVFSDACNKAMEFGKPVLMRDDWNRFVSPTRSHHHPADHLRWLWIAPAAACPAGQVRCGTKPPRAVSQFSITGKR